MQIIRYKNTTAKKKIVQYLAAEGISPQVHRSAERILKLVRRQGDTAVSNLTQELDKVAIPAGRARIPQEELQKAVDALPESFMRAFETARKNIVSYYELQKREHIRLDAEQGYRLDTLFRPIETVGLYVPGGNAPLVSTVLMSAVPARVAGVGRIVVCTPPDKEGKVHPYLLAACWILGIREVFRVGGAQAIGAMAYGTETIPAVDKIFGPGNSYVTAAKAKVFGKVGVDLLAGPSEIVIVADELANTDYLAADLLSQAEHDAQSKAVLLTDCEQVLRETRDKVQEQMKDLPRREIAARSIDAHCLLVQTEDMQQAMDIANKLAPEHLQIVTRDPRDLLPEVRNAGTVLLGQYSPAVVGDFVAGPSHVLPTNRSARAFSGICVDDFLKKVNVIEFSREALAGLESTIKEFALAEGLEGHYRSARMRLQTTKIS